MTPVRVVLVDDHPIFRDGLRAALEGVSDVVVVGEAADGAEAVTVSASLHPDVVLMDLSMPVMGGLEATATICRMVDPPAVLVLTMNQDDTAVFAAVRAGASGFLLKGDDRDSVVRAVLAVHHGEAVFGPGVARRVLAHFAAEEHAGLPGLTPREHEIMDLVASGLGNQAIARRLFLSDKTVRNNVANILVKLQVHDRAEAIAVARRAGLGEI
jgi:DNA-binding NarL/FixJ family response regulator